MVNRKNLFWLSVLCGACQRSEEIVYWVWPFLHFFFFFVTLDVYMSWLECNFSYLFLQYVWFGDSGAHFGGAQDIFMWL